MKLEKLLQTIVLGTALFLGNAQPAHSEEVIRRQSDGQTYTWKGKTNSDYFPSGKNALFIKSKPEYVKGVTGGFKEDIRLLTHFGTYADRISDKTLGGFIKKYSSQMDSKLIDVVKQIARDKYVFIALKQFMEENGKLEDSSGGRGRCLGDYGCYPTENTSTPYVGLNIKEIMDIEGHTRMLSNRTDIKENMNGDYDVPKIGDENSPREILYHEMLHYVFDKSDSSLAEEQSADHTAIKALLERFCIVYSIRNGEAPLKKSVCTLYGKTDDGKIGDEIKLLIEQNDLNGLEKLVNSERVYTNLIRSGMLTQLSRQSFLLKNTASGLYDLSDEQLQDIGYIYAVNSSILQQSLRLGVHISKKNEKKKIAFPEAFREKEYQKKFSKFLKTFAYKIYQNPNLPVCRTGFETMDEMMQTKPAHK